MIKFFRQSYAIQYVVIALIAIAFWIPAFTTTKTTTNLGCTLTPLFNLLDHLLDFSIMAKNVFAFSLIVLETLIFNAIMVKNQIIGKVSTMGAFVFVLMMNLTVTQTQFYPFAMSVVFILLAISNMFDIYQLPNPEMNLLKAGVYVSLASFCYFPSILLLLWIALALPVVKKGTLRLQLIPVFGFLFVYFLYFVCNYFFGDIKLLIYEYLTYFTSIKLSVNEFNLQTILLLSFLLVSTNLMLFCSSSASFEKTVAVRTKVSMTIILSAFALLSLFLGGDVMMNGLIFIVLSILVSYTFSYLGNTGWADLILTLFLVLVFGNHFCFKLL